MTVGGFCSYLYLPAHWPGVNCLRGLVNLGQEVMDNYLQDGGEVTVAPIRVQHRTFASKSISMALPVLSKVP